MLGRTKIAAQKYHLGQLLVAARIISNESLDDALHLAKGTRLPLGRVLTISGKLNDYDLPALLEAQRLAKEGWVPVDSVVNVLRQAHLSKVAFDEALVRQGWLNFKPTNVNPNISAISFASGDQLDEAPPEADQTADQCSDIDYSDIRNLLQDACHVTSVYELGPIDPILFDLAIRCQRLISQGFISRQHAVFAIACYNESVSPQRPINPEQGVGFRRLVSHLAVRTPEQYLAATA